MTYAQPSTDPTNVVGRRIGAWFIDLIIYLVIATAIGLALGGAGTENITDFQSGRDAQSFCDQWQEDNNGFCFSSDDGDGNPQATTFKVGGSSLWLPGHFVLYALIQGITGGSLGKLAVGLRVVTEDGRRCGIGRSFLRTILWIADAITCAIPILGGILLVSTKGHRRLGDMAAKTFVVSKEQEGRPVAVPGLTAAAPSPYGSPSYAAAGAGGAWGAQPQGPAPTATPNAEGPTWDGVRNAYIQYDQAQEAWVQWNDTSQSWGPIDQ